MIKKNTGPGARPGRWLPVLALAGSLSVLYMARREPASEPRHELHYTVPAGPLDRVLLDVARVTGSPLVFSPELTEGRTSRGVSGMLTREEALRMALDGSGLAVTTQKNGVIGIAPDVVGEAAGTGRSGRAFVDRQRR